MTILKAIPRSKILVTKVFNMVRYIIRLMKQAYVRGYYGYKNFGDELLFFGVIDWIFSHYPEIQELVIEVNNKTWMEYRVKKNYQEYTSKEQYHKISFVEIKQHRWKYLTHIISLLGFGKYRSYFKFFG
ncbi:TPA: hypothetical protein DIC40_00975 [Patescibacteria group bacterium]|nr:hypothetical protein [Candidatus Gracilibacteria bacterium]